MPGVAGLVPARFALGSSADFRTTPGLIFFLLFLSLDFSDVARADRANRSAPVPRPAADMGVPKT